MALVFFFFPISFLLALISAGITRARREVWRKVTRTIGNAIALSPREERAGREPERRAADLKLHLSPALSPNFIGGEGEIISRPLIPDFVRLIPPFRENSQGIVAKQL